jgi:LysR family hca operon transcriptional activator
MRDLEAELGCELMIRGAKGVELTAAGRVLLDHARVVLLQVEAATEATRRASTPAKKTFVIGFLTGYEFDWLPSCEFCATNCRTPRSSSSARRPRISRTA